MTIARHAAAPLLVVLACATARAGQGSTRTARGRISQLDACFSTTSPTPPADKLLPDSAARRRLTGPDANWQTYHQAKNPQAAQTTLPRGGREVFPRYRLVGYAGVTGAATLGRLGTGPLNQRVAEIERRAEPYAVGREILPVVEVIATVVQGSPGRDGSTGYASAMRRLPRTTRLLASIGPCCCSISNQVDRNSSPEAKAFEKWLKQPDVGVALDPEWAMDPGQRPARRTGTRRGRAGRGCGVSVRSGQAVQPSGEGDGLSPGGPQRGTPGIRTQGPRRGGHDQVGRRARASWPQEEHLRVVNKSTPKYVHAGFKLFFTEDRRNGGRLMTPQEVLVEAAA